MATPSLPSFSSDLVIIRDLRTNATVGKDRWGKVRSQPVAISVYVNTSLVAAGRSDNVTDSIHYGDLCKDISKLVESRSYDDIRMLADAVANLVLSKDRAESARVVVEALNQFLMAESLGISISRARDGTKEVVGPDQLIIKDLRLATIIGVNPPERESKQIVVTNIVFHSPTWSKKDWNELHAQLTKVCCRKLLSLPMLRLCI